LPKAKVEQGCRPWFFGGSCVRSNPDEKPTKTERNVTIAGIFFVCLFAAPILQALLFYSCKPNAEKGDRGACRRVAACAASLLFILCIGIAALQEVRTVGDQLILRQH